MIRRGGSFAEVEALEEGRGILLLKPQPGEGPQHETAADGEERDHTGEYGEEREDAHRTIQGARLDAAVVYAKVMNPVR